MSAASMAQDKMGRGGQSHNKRKDKLARDNQGGTSGREGCAGFRCRALPAPSLGVGGLGGGAPALGVERSPAWAHWTTGGSSSTEQETRFVVSKTEGCLKTAYRNKKTQVIRLVVLKESLETPPSPPVSCKPA